MTGTEPDRRTIAVAWLGTIALGHSPQLVVAEGEAAHLGRRRPARWVALSALFGAVTWLESGFGAARSGGCA